MSPHLHISVQLVLLQNDECEIAACGIAACAVVIFSKKKEVSRPSGRKFGKEIGKKELFKKKKKTPTTVQTCRILFCSSACFLSTLFIRVGI